MHWFFKLLLIALLITFCLFFILFVRPKLSTPVLVSNTSVHGIIWQNERWSGVVKIDGDIFALPGVTVDVSPGTNILVSINNDKSNMDWIPQHSKSGVNASNVVEYGIRHGEPFLDEKQKISIRIFKFYVYGTKEHPVVISSDAPQRSPYDFNSFFINKGILSNVSISNFRKLHIGPSVQITDSSIFDYGECVCINRGSPMISNTVFNNSLRDYIVISRASPTISGNLFLSIKGNGIVVEPKRSGSPLISHNEFQLPGKSAVIFLGGDEKIGATITRNIFAAGDISIPCDSRVKIYQNYIKSSINFIKSGNCNGSIKIGANYWEIQDPERILKERIIGTETSFKVLLDGILKEPPIDAGIK
jgi:hypothetical protein